MEDYFKDFKSQIGDIVRHKAFISAGDGMVIARELVQDEVGVSKFYSVRTIYAITLCKEFELESLLSR